MSADTGHRIEEALQLRGMTQRDLAAACVPPLSKQAINAIVKGRRPGKKHLATFARVLDVPLKWLLTGDDAPVWAKNERELVQRAAAMLAAESESKNRAAVEAAADSVRALVELRVKQEMVKALRLPDAEFREAVALLTAHRALLAARGEAVETVERLLARILQINLALEPVPLGGGLKVARETFRRICGHGDAPWPFPLERS